MLAKRQVFAEQKLEAWAFGWGFILKFRVYVSETPIGHSLGIGATIWRTTGETPIGHLVGFNLQIVIHFPS